MTERWNHLATLFGEALDRPAEERERFLEQRCEGEPELRQELLSMLGVHGEEHALQVEGRLGPESPAGATDEGERIGQRLGNYRVLELIGRGGMGEVYRAERDDDLYDKCVAIKVVQGGPRGAALMRRFRQERAILARLEDAHVARLLDAGVSEDGRPYLVMEFVDGLPINEYCDHKKLSLDARLDLFREVCGAVQRAHAKLVLHRDLKPSNILVTDEGVVKLLDFGIAKLLDPEEPAGDLTVALDRVMTPEHAAPEQIRGEAVTTAADVYSLGVLLYELLTSKRPREFSSPFSADMVRRLEDETPAAPSRAEFDADVSGNRGLSARALRRRLAGDLDTITLMALHAQPERRYPSPLALAEDLQRHQRGMPVLAQRDRVGYRARKFLRRNRWAAGSAAAFLLLTIAFAAVSKWQSHQLAHERDRAQSERAQSEQLLGVLVGLFEEASPGQATDFESVEVRQILERGERMAETLEFGSVLRARLWEILGSIRASRSELDQAQRLYSLAIESAADSLMLARLLHREAVLITRRDGIQAGRPLLTASLARHRRLLGDRDLETVQAMQDMAPALGDPREGRRLAQQALNLRRELAPDDESALAGALHRLGGVEIGAGEYAAAREHLEQAAAILARVLPQDHPRRLVLDQDLTSFFVRRGEWERAEAVQRRVLETKLRIYGEHSDLVAGSWQILGVTLANMGRTAEAADAFAQTLAIYRETLAPDHWRVANAARNVGQLLALQGNYAEGIPYLDEAIEINQRVGATAQARAYMQGQRAMMQLGLGQIDSAAAELERVESGIRSDPTARSDYVADSLVWLGCARLHQTGRAAEAEDCFRQALEVRAQNYADDHPRIFEAQCGIGASLVEAGQLDAGTALLRRYLPLYESWGLCHPLLREAARSALRRAEG